MIVGKLWHANQAFLELDDQLHWTGPGSADAAWEIMPSEWHPEDGEEIAWMLGRAASRYGGRIEQLVFPKNHPGTVC
jgi:hypothetical protein